MENLLFFVEGFSDERFLSGYLQHTYGINLNNDQFINLKGYNDRVIELNKPTLDRYLALSKKPILIFDADSDFENRHNQLTQEIGKHDLDIEFFLFPDNLSNGCLEDLLLNIIAEDHHAIAACFENYKECLNERYYKPNNKSKVYAILEAVNPKQIKDKDRNYRDSSLWNLNSISLDPLKNFIDHLLD